VVLYVVTASGDAAAVVRTAFGWLGTLGSGLSDVVTEAANSP